MAGILHEVLWTWPRLHQPIDLMSPLVHAWPRLHQPIDLSSMTPYKLATSEKRRIFIVAVIVVIVIFMHHHHHHHHHVCRQLQLLTQTSVSMTSLPNYAFSGDDTPRLDKLQPFYPILQRIAKNLPPWMSDATYDRICGFLDIRHHPIPARNWSLYCSPSRKSGLFAPTVPVQHG